MDKFPVNPPLRLRKFLSQHTNLTNQQIKQLYEDGKIVVRRKENDALPCDVGLYEDGLTQLLFPDEEDVFINGEKLEPNELNQVYVVFYKPKGVLTDCSTTEIHCNLVPWINEISLNNPFNDHSIRVAPVGRLDKETTGLLLLTNDSDLNHAIRKKKNNVTKQYLLYVEDKIDPVYKTTLEERLRDLSKGVLIDNELITPISVKNIELTDFNLPELTFKTRNRVVTVYVEISMGKKHIVRKMCKAARLNLLHLHRDKIGTVTLDNIKYSSYRYLSNKEAEELWEAAGGRDIVRKSRTEAALRLYKIYLRDNIENKKLTKWYTAHKEYLKEIEKDIVL